MLSLPGHKFDGRAIVQPLKIPMKIALFLTLFGACVLSSSAATSGEVVYQKRCAACHEQVNDRIPPREALQKMPASRILKALDAGAMMAIAFTISREDRMAVASYLGTNTPERGPSPAAFCADRKVNVSAKPKTSWNGWSPGLNNARFQGGDAARLTVDQVRKLKLKWAFGFDGDVTAFAPPTVIDGQMFVGSAAGVVHAMRAETGCLQWVFQANGPVRSSIAVVPLGGQHALLFGDMTGWFTQLPPKRASCSGRCRWNHMIPPGSPAHRWRTREPFTFR